MRRRMAVMGLAWLRASRPKKNPATALSIQPCLPCPPWRRCGLRRREPHERRERRERHESRAGNYLFGLAFFSSASRAAGTCNTFSGREIQKRDEEDCPQRHPCE